jgi:hypothetical protein
MRNRSTSTPRCRADLSPRASRSSRRATTRAPTTPGAVEGPELPEHDLLAGLGVAEERHQRDPRPGDSIHRDAGEDERDHLGAPGPPRRGIGEERGGEPADERRTRRAPLRQEAARGPTEHDHDGGAERRARGDADDAGLGQRVAEDTLHEHPADGEPATGEDRQGNPGEAHRPQRALAVGMRHRDVVVDAHVSQHGAEDLDRRDTEVADPHREEDESQEQRPEDDEEHSDAAATAGPRGALRSGAYAVVGPGRDGGAGAAQPASPSASTAA